MYARLRRVRRLRVQVDRDYPTHEEVRWWMRNHTTFPYDFHIVRRLYEEAKQKGKTKDENDKRICDAGAS